MPAPTARRSNVRRIVAGLALAAALATAATACSTPAPGTDELTDALVTSGVPEPVAACTSEAVHDTLSEDQIAELAERGSGGAPADDPTRTDDAADQLRDALSACRAQLAESTTTTTTAGGSTTTTVAPDDGGASGGAGAGSGTVGTDGAVIDTTPTTAAP